MVSFCGIILNPIWMVQINAGVSELPVILITSLAELYLPEAL